MNRRLLRLALAATLAIVGAFWFAVDFSSSHAANPGAVVAGGSGTAPILAEPEGLSRQSWLSRAALSTLVAGGAIPDPPFVPVVAVAGCYFLGRTWFKHWSMRR